MFQQHFPWRSVLLATIALWLLLQPQVAAAADAIVSGACTETEFDAALATVQSSGGGTLTFACGGVKTITLTNQKSLIANTTLDGGGVITLSGGNSTRLFFVNGGVHFVTHNITLSNGSSPVGGGLVEATGAQLTFNHTRLANSRANDQGGAIYCFVGTSGALTLTNSSVEGNLAHRGGGVYNDGCTMTVVNSHFLNNRATLTSTLTAPAGGALYNAPNAALQLVQSSFQGNEGLDGGGLYNAAGATALLQGVTLQGNRGGYGGGLENSGVVTLTQSLLELNSVTGSGGGLWNLGGTVTLQATTVRNNSAYEGGGVNSYGTHLQLTDANIVGNIATGSHGGGIYHGGGAAFIRNVTISGNQANATTANGGGIYQNADDNLTLTNATVMNNQAGLFGGGFYHAGRYAILTNVTLGDNQAGAAGNAIYEDSPLTPANPGVIQLVNSVLFGSANNCDGATFQSLGHNLSKGTCSALSAASDQDNYAGDLRLGALTFNGGAFPMQTSLPLAGSPLLNGGDPVQCSATDQRGAPRVGLCEIGAVEGEAQLPRLYLPVVTR